MKHAPTDVKAAYDVIVVGSGPSGSVIANELTRAGVKCLMLEAGKYYPRDSLTHPEIDYYSQLYWSGGMELDTSCKNGIMRGKAVGGGTLAYQAIMCRFDEYVFGPWREKSGIRYFTVEEMEPWYKRADQLLPIALVDERYRNECCRIFVEGLAKLGYTARAELRAMDDCHWDKGNDCICCLGGCRIDGKGSMPHTVLKRALTQGLHLIPEFEVKGVEVKADGVLLCFSECGFVEHIDRMIAYIHPHDRDTLGGLLKILRFVSTFVIRVLLKLTQLDRFFPGAIGPHLRKLDIGLRGIVLSLYYSFLDVPGGYGQRIKEAIRWGGDIRSQPEKADELPDLIQAANPLGRV